MGTLAADRSEQFVNEINCCIAVRWEDVKLCINQRRWLLGQLGGAYHAGGFRDVRRGCWYIVGAGAGCGAWVVMRDAGDCTRLGCSGR